MERVLAMEEGPEPPAEAPRAAPEGLARELPRVRALLARLLGRAGRAADADDLLQEVALRAVRYARAFDPRRPLGPWLRRAAVRAWLDEAERARRRPATLGEDDAREAAPEIPDRLAERDELARLLAALSAREREVLLRFHAGGESVAAIARALALPEGTVKSHLHRARQKLAGRAEETDGR